MKMEELRPKVQGSWLLNMVEIMHLSLVFSRGYWRTATTVTDTAFCYWAL